MPPTKSRLIFVWLIGLLMHAVQAANPVFIQTLGPLSLSFSRPISSPYPATGHMAGVQIGGSPVPISSIGVYAKVETAARVSWVIYANSEYSYPIYRSEAVSYSPMTSPGWLDSPDFSPFTLAANTTYYIGLIVDGPLDAVRFYYNDEFRATPYTQNGVTLLHNVAANPIGYINPEIWLGTSSVQLGIRLRRGGPTLNQPQSGSSYQNIVPVSFLLPGKAVAGSVKLTFNDGISARALTLAASHETVGSHSFSFDSSNPTQSPEISTGTPIPDGHYSVLLSYQSAENFALLSMLVQDVRIDTVRPVFTIDGGTLLYTENDTPRQIAPGSETTDDNWNNGSLEVQITTNPSPSDLIAISNVAGVSINGTKLMSGPVNIGFVEPSGGYVSGSNRLKITFNNNISDIILKNVLRSITFSVTSDNPSPADRTVTLTLKDGAGLDAFATRTISVVPVNDAPVLTPANATLVFTEGKNVASKAMVIAPTINIADADNASLATGTVALTTGFVRGEDVLHFDSTGTTGNIVGRYDPATGILTLTSPEGTAAIHQWQAALRSVTYLNTSQSPTASRRTLTMEVHDGALSSNIATRFLDVISVNDSPVAEAQSVAVDEDTDRAITLTGYDPDNATLSYLIVSHPKHGTLTGIAPHLRYTPAPDYYGSDSFTFKISDGLEDSNTATVTLAVSSINDAPTLAPLPDLEIVENSGTQVIPLLGISSGAMNEDQPLIISAASDKPALIASATSSYTSPGISGVLSFKPLPQANGTATITVTVDDGGAINSAMVRTFTVRVLPVNDAPSFNIQGDISVAQDAGSQSLPNWVRDITPGPADEDGQSVRFHVTTNQPGLFDEQPSISPDGTLSFIPSVNASGIAIISVIMTDDGGTIRGGADTSTPKSFRIAVTTYKEERGTYNGLVQGAANVPSSHAQEGLIRLTMAESGRFTGRLSLGGKHHSLKGQFDKSGIAYFGSAGSPSLSLNDKGQTPLSMRLHLDVSEGSDVLVGSISQEGTRFAEIHAHRALFTAKSKATAPFRSVPESLLGRYTTLFVSRDLSATDLDQVEAPKGNGFGRLNITKAGVAKISGRLADGTPFVYSNAISKGHVWPLYLHLDKRGGSVSGWVSFRDIPGLSDADGADLKWFKPEVPRRQIYPDGWPTGIPVDLIGSRYTAQPILNGNIEASLEGGNLPEAGVQQTGVIKPTGRIVVVTPAADKLSLNVSTATGLIKGSFVHPVSRKKTSLNGVIFQKQEFGSGFFLGEDGTKHLRSGSIDLRSEPPPRE